MKYHELALSDYNSEQFSLMRNVEALTLVAIFDSADPPKPTIGIGFNLLDNASIRNLVIATIGLDPTNDELTSEQRTREELYRDDLIAILTDLKDENGNTITTKEQLQAALNFVMGERSIDSTYDGVPSSVLERRTTFAFESDSEAVTVFQSSIAEFEFKVNQWLPGIPLSLERTALFSLAYNSQSLESEDSLLGPKLRDAIEADNRAAAWYEIRYRSNKNSLATTP